MPINVSISLKYFLDTTEAINLSYSRNHRLLPVPPEAGQQCQGYARGSGVQRRLNRPVCLFERAPKNARRQLYSEQPSWPGPSQEEESSQKVFWPLKPLETHPTRLFPGRNQDPGPQKKLHKILRLSSDASGNRAYPIIFRNLRWVRVLFPFENIQVLTPKNVFLWLSGPKLLSPFWVVLFYFTMILFGLAQQMALVRGKGK